MSDSHDSIPANPPHRRFLDRKTSTPTLVGMGTRFEGQLNCAGDLAVAGDMIGNSDIRGMLTLSETGTWRGIVHCSHALLAGKLDGELRVDGKLEVRATARITGQVSARQIAVAEGAIIQGELNVLSGEPVQRFVEKRHGT